MGSVRELYSQLVELLPDAEVNREIRDEGFDFLVTRGGSSVAIEVKNVRNGPVSISEMVEQLTSKSLVNKGSGRSPDPSEIENGGSAGVVA